MKASAASRIQALFPSQTLVEVHVQDGSGDPYEVFVGPVQALTAGHFDGVFRESGCFYNLTVIGIHENLVQAVDIHPSNIMRSEFLWLTAPAPPKLTLEDSTRVEICWEGLKFCGTAGPRGQSSSGVEYILEVAEGCEWKGGKSAHFVTDLTVETYRQLWRGRVPKPVGVFDLQPGMRYYARVAVEYLGNRHVSEALCFHTSACPPTAPLIPRAYISPPTNQIDPSADYPPNILLKWSNVKPNGSEVMHFQVQMQQVLLSAAAPQSEAFSPLLAKRLNHVKTEKKILRGGKWVSLPSPKAAVAAAAAAAEPRSAAPYFQDQTLIITRWTDIFCHLDKKVKLCPPPPGVIEWRFRVRARNALGWSNFSPELCLHNRSHPTLFSAEYPPEYVGEALRLCSYSPSSPTPIISDSFYPAQQLLSSASESLSPPPHQQQQQQQYKSHHHQPQHHQEYYDNNAGNVYADSLEYIETLGGTAGAAPGVGRRPRATSALPSTSHANRRESFSSETGAGGVSAGNSRVMDEHGLDTFSTDRSALSSRGRSAGARLASH
jgi:hypothetical protein